MSDITPIIVPLLNVNDDSVELVQWLVQHGSEVSEGQVICEVESSKALTELTAEASGVLYHVEPSPGTVDVGSRIGIIGPEMDVIRSYIQAEPTRQVSSVGTSATNDTRTVRATPRARLLAKRLGLDLAQIAREGRVRGTVKESDVRRFTASDRSGADDGIDRQEHIPDWLSTHVHRVGLPSRHDQLVASGLRQSVQTTLMTDIDVEVNLTSINAGVQRLIRQGTMVSLLHVAISALSRCLSDYPDFMSFHHSGSVYRYNVSDIAFVTRTPDGRLFAPVLRELEQLDVGGVARQCQAAAIRTSRGQITSEDLEGACFTVSHIPTSGVTRFVALPNQYQSAILAIGSEREQLVLENDELQMRKVVTLTLNYDHTLIDGMYAAEFMGRVVQEMNSVAT